MNRKKSASQPRQRRSWPSSEQRADDRRAEARTSQPPMEPPEDGGNVPWGDPPLPPPEPRYDPDTCPVGYPAYEGRTFAELIDEIQELQHELRENRRELRNLREQLVLSREDHA